MIDIAYELENLEISSYSNDIDSFLQLKMKIPLFSSNIIKVFFYYIFIDVPAMYLQHHSYYYVVLEKAYPFL